MGKTIILNISIVVEVLGMHLFSCDVHIHFRAQCKLLKLLEKQLPINFWCFLNATVVFHRFIKTFQSKSFILGG